VAIVYFCAHVFSIADAVGVEATQPIVTVALRRAPRSQTV